LKTARLDRILFFLILCLEFSLILFLNFKNRIPNGHDTFEYFTLQYYFLNHAVMYGEIPQWMPFMTHGTVATWWYAIQAGILQNVLLLATPLLKGINFIQIFNAGIFFDELLLLVGTWLFARRFLSPAAAFFTAVSVMGSCIWAGQVWFNFHFYYAMPLMLDLLHRFLEQGQWRYLALAGNLFAVQMLANLPYYPPVLSLVIAIYFSSYTVCNPREIRKKIFSLKFSMASVAAIAAVLFSLFAVLLLLRTETGLLTKYYLGRNPDGTVPLKYFLEYGGTLNPGCWMESFLRISPCVDYNLYIGILGISLALLGLFTLRRKNAHFLLAAVLISLFAMGTPLAVFFYYAWPGMKFFRHLSLVTLFAKYFLCLLAGAGLDGMFTHAAAMDRIKKSKFRFFFVGAVLFAVSANALILLKNHETLRVLLAIIVPNGLSKFAWTFLPRVITARAVSAAILAIISGVLVISGAAPQFKKYSRVILFIALALHLWDLGEYKFSETCLRTVSLNQKEAKITAFQPMPYATRRIASPNSGELRTFFCQKRVSYGAAYFSLQSFTFQDEIGNAYRTDHWLLPLDSYMKTYWGQSLRDTSTPPAGFEELKKLDFPLSHPASGKIAGLTEDKIQFFETAYVFPDIYFAEQDLWTSAQMNRPDYNGDIPFLHRPGRSPKNIPGTIEWAPEKPVSLNARLTGPYRILFFDANRLNLAVNMPPDLKSAWLLYSDTWHPRWKATVNGKPVTVFKANLAYKAVPLSKGPNLIHFTFHSPVLSALYAFFEINSLFWLFGILWLLSGIYLRPKTGYNKFVRDVPVNY